jgi:hypothetical protein
VPATLSSPSCTRAVLLQRQLRLTVAPHPGLVQRLRCVRRVPSMLEIEISSTLRID